MFMNLEQEVGAIVERNKRVEKDKAWEVSFIRRVFLVLVTYVVALVWLVVIHESLAWLKAVVPAAGYLLSTLTLPSLKKWWLKKTNI